jgi:hypothetical protein
MAILKNIEVTQCDNQLIGLAVPSGGSASVELFDFKLGGGTVAAPIKYSVPNINILQPGEYTLLILGINWGGPATFTVTVDFETGPPTFCTTPKMPQVSARFLRLPASPSRLHESRLCRIRLSKCQAAVWPFGAEPGRLFKLRSCPRPVAPGRVARHHRRHAKRQFCRHGLQQGARAAFPDRRARRARGRFRARVHLCR